MIYPKIWSSFMYISNWGGTFLKARMPRNVQILRTCKAEQARGWGCRLVASEVLGSSNINYIELTLIIR